MVNAITAYEPARPSDCPLHLKSVFGSVVAVAFQITFRAEIHNNDVFLFFKNHF